MVNFEGEPRSRRSWASIARPRVYQELLADHTSGVGTGIPARKQITVSGEAANQILMTLESANGGGSKLFIGTCPDCGSPLQFAEGCLKCTVAGFSECG